jgi:hypothetical protein
LTNTATSGSISLGAAPTVVKVSGPGTFTTYTTGLTGTVCTASTVLPAGQSCVIGVQYTPGGSGLTAQAHMAIGASTTQIGGNFPAN